MLPEFLFSPVHAHQRNVVIIIRLCPCLPKHILLSLLNRLSKLITVVSSYTQINSQIKCGYFLSQTTIYINNLSFSSKISFWYDASVFQIKLVSMLLKTLQNIFIWHYISFVVHSFYFSFVKYCSKRIFSCTTTHFQAHEFTFVCICCIPITMWYGYENVSSYLSINFSFTCFTYSNWSIENEFEWNI